MRGRFDVETSGPILPFLFEKFPEVKRTKVRQWLKFGAVRVNGNVVSRHDHPISIGDRIELKSLETPKPAATPRGIPIIFEDEHLLVVEKPAGLLSVAAKEGVAADTAYSRLTDYVRQTQRGRGARVWIVHRLDRETSGLMVFAKTEEAKRFLQGNWEDVEKRYVAVVEGAPARESGTLRSHLDESNPFRVRSVRQGEGTREAVTHYRVLQRGEKRSLLALILETGRRHQIRVQLAEMGCPVVGDEKYHPGPVTGRMALHCAELKLPHPDGDRLMEFESVAPESFKNLFQ